jgi:hypothetical protein
MSVSVLQSHIVTVTVGASGSGGDSAVEGATTTVEWADDAILFAEAETVRAYVYPSASEPTPWTCWGPACPLSYETSPTFASPVPTAPPTTHFAPPESCLDPGNLWVVTTSCYLTSPSGLLQDASTPEWLQCSMMHFGAPAWDDPTCRYYSSGARTTATTTVTENGVDAVGQEVLYYDGCPAGYAGVASGSGPAYNTLRYNVGWFDISYHTTFCCPTLVPPLLAPSRTISESTLCPHHVYSHLCTY